MINDVTGMDKLNQLYIPIVYISIFFRNVICAYSAMKD